MNYIDSYVILELVYLYCNVRTKTAISISNMYYYEHVFKDFTLPLKRYLIQRKMLSKWKCLKKINNRRVWVRRRLHSENDPILLY